MDSGSNTEREVSDVEVIVAKGPSRARAIGVGVWLAIVGVIAGFIATSDDPRDRSGDDWIYLGIVALVVTLLWWLMVVRPVARADGNTPAKVGLIAAIVAVLSIVVFWTGLPFVLGAGAFVLGVEGRERARRGAGRSGPAQAATIIGGIVSAGWLGVMIVGLLTEI